MLRVTLVSLSLGIVSAGMTKQCMQSLQHLQGGSDIELAVRCRAAFGPQACKQAKQALGAQPWSQNRMEESCAVFAESYEGLDARSLEAAIEKKGSTPMEATLKDNKHAATSPAPAASQPRGPVANLLNKLKEQKKKDVATEKSVVDATPEKSRLSSPLAGMIKNMKDAKTAHEATKPKEAETKQGTAAKETPFIEEDEEGPLTAMLKKMAAAPKKAAPLATPQVEQDEQGPLAAMFNRAEAQRAPLLKLYGDVPVETQADTSHLARVLAVLGGAALVAALTLFAVSRRVDAHGRHGRDEFSEELDAENSME